MMGPNPKQFSGYITAAAALDDDEDPCPGPDDDMTFSSGAPRGVVFGPATWTERTWAKPSEAIIHIYQAYGWGNLQWRLKAVDTETSTLWFGDGGHQMGAKWSPDPCAVDHRSHFYVENVLEELDAPGEWYFDADQGLLYFLPPSDLDLANATVEVPLVEQLIRFDGTQERPVQHVHLHGIRFAHTTTTFMQRYEVPSLSDWSIHRGGTVFLTGTRDCSIRACWFDAVGGNAVFASGYNRDMTVESCTFTEAGDSAICFVGALETTVGTQRSFPYECRAIKQPHSRLWGLWQTDRRSLHFTGKADYRRA